MNKQRKHIIFDEKSHTYTNINNGIKYQSSTGFVGLFHEEFDQWKIAQNLVDNNSRYKDYTVESLVNEWKERTAIGSQCHLILENCFNGIETKPNHLVDLEERNLLMKAWEKLKIKERYSDWEIIPEMLLFNDDYQLAGQSDLILLNHLDKTFKVVDYKTNRKGIGWSGFNGKKMYQPIEHLDDCNGIHYSLQLSLYSMMLQKELGYKCAGLTLLWIDTDNWTITPIKALELYDELQLCLDKYKTHITSPFFNLVQTYFDDLFRIIPNPKRFIQERFGRPLFHFEVNEMASLVNQLKEIENNLSF